MVGSGHSGDGAVSLPAPGWAGIGTGTLRELAVEPGHPLVLLDHHLILLVTRGHGRYEVDFHGRQCRPGTLIWACPGQVVRPGGANGLDASLVCWDPSAVHSVAGIGDERFGPTYWQLAGEDEDAVITEVSQLTVDCERHRSGELAVDLLRHQLAVVLLRLTLLPEADRPAETTLFRGLRQEVEQSYPYTRRVEDYADRLGCSVRTLTRACLVATGRSAKQVIDDRAALQAMRLLAATDLPVADIGRCLGFAEPTNFGRFFHREVGCSPGAFRAGLVEPAQPAPRSPTMPAGPKSRPAAPESCEAELREAESREAESREAESRDADPLVPEPLVPAPRRPVEKAERQIPSSAGLAGHSFL